jgi:hypothetical protein
VKREASLAQLEQRLEMRGQTPTARVTASWRDRSRRRVDGDDKPPSQIDTVRPPIPRARHFAKVHQPGHLCAEKSTENVAQRSFG